MLEFPASARVNRFIAKENFYKQIDSKTKKLFQDYISRITWEYKLSQNTINLPGRAWPEIEIFRITLKDTELPQKVLRVIDSAIPYPILFIIEQGSIMKAVICYKELDKKNENFARVDTYFETGWNDKRLEDIKIEGLSIDAVYENFIRQIAGDDLRRSGVDSKEHTAEIKDEIEKKKEDDKILKQIAALERKKQREPSIGKKQEIAKQIFKLKQLL